VEVLRFVSCIYPHLVFIENEVDGVALYGEMDAAHMIGFQAVNNKVLFENSVVEKVLNLRDECQIHKRNLVTEDSLKNNINHVLDNCEAPVSVKYLSLPCKRYHG
jgi:hypothetical protein